MDRNFILDTDSYKASHFLQYPDGLEGLFAYLESRGGRHERTLFFGLQYIVKEYLAQPVSRRDVDEAEAFFAAHGEPFPRAGWDHIVALGHLPLRIRAVDEGTLVPTHNVLMTVESTDPLTPWLVTWVETQLMRVWYPTTVATTSYHCKRTLLEHLTRSADAPFEEIDFKLHDFGARGVSSRESAGIGGMSHLCSFKGSDTVEGVRFANEYYGTREGMAAYSIPAAEHSTITSWGRAGERDAYANMVRQFAKPGAIVACVSDSYDLFHAVDAFWCGDLLDAVKASGATVVIRPDSGDPAEIVLEVLRRLDANVGTTTNTKGFKVLPRFFRVIQGDGVNERSIDQVLTAIEDAGYSATNVTFGMGGALLQQVDRDTQKFAYKCSAVLRHGEWLDVCKMPATDRGKASKAGRLDLVRDTQGGFATVASRVGEASRGSSALRTVYENGALGEGATLDAIRDRVNASLRADLGA